MRKAMIAILAALTLMVVAVSVSLASASTAQISAPIAGPVLAVTPARIMDTRANFGVSGPIAPVQDVSLQVSGRGGVPSSATSVYLNVTATQPTAGGYITVYPTGSSLPTASSLNFFPGQTTPNLVLILLGTGGKIQLFNGSFGTVHLIADVTGYVDTPGAPITGPTGPTGPAGSNGTNGTDGAVGPAGSNGTNGTNGTSGTDGAVGPAGANGNDGAIGPQGPQGDPGPVGPTGPQGPQGDPGQNATVTDTATVTETPTETTTPTTTAVSTTTPAASVLRIVNNVNWNSKRLDITVTTQNPAGSWVVHSTQDIPMGTGTRISLKMNAVDSISGWWISLNITHNGTTGTIPGGISSGGLPYTFAVIDTYLGTASYGKYLQIDSLSLS